ncbi:hypothetical protein ACS0TY_012883 [Phlomoides rotata]
MIDDASRKYISLESENNVLSARVTELTDRPRSLNSVLETVVSGIVLDILDIPDLLLEPWQLPFPIQPINTFAVHMFRC